jgi:hypothetical protein
MTHAKKQRRMLEDKGAEGAALMAAIRKLGSVAMQYRRDELDAGSVFGVLQKGHMDCKVGKNE